jgi:hypothetical protein
VPELLLAALLALVQVPAQRLLVQPSLERALRLRLVRSAATRTAEVVLTAVGTPRPCSHWPVPQLAVALQAVAQTLIRLVAQLAPPMVAKTVDLVPALVPVQPSLVPQLPERAPLRLPGHSAGKMMLKALLQVLPTQPRAQRAALLTKQATLPELPQTRPVTLLAPPVMLPRVFPEQPRVLPLALHEPRPVLPDLLEQRHLVLQAPQETRLLMQPVLRATKQVTLLERPRARLQPLEQVLPAPLPVLQARQKVKARALQTRPSRIAPAVSVVRLLPLQPVLAQQVLPLQQRLVATTMMTRTPTKTAA